LLKTIFLNLKNFELCQQLIQKNISDFSYFLNIGWTFDEISNQIKKDTNKSIGLLKFDRMIGFIIGNFLYIEKKSEYEILILYIDNDYRKLGYASYLINVISKSSFLYPLKTITLEVSESNIPAINLYKKNKFNQIGKRKNYYTISKNFKETAIIFEKKINEKRS